MTHKDLGLTAEQLDDKYNPFGDGEHPDISRSDWVDAVNAQLTDSSYWGWVVYKIRSSQDSADFAQGGHDA